MRIANDASVMAGRRNGLLVDVPGWASVVVMSAAVAMIAAWL
jgi:hypothetical protein